MISTGFLSDARTVATHLSGSPLSGVIITDSDVWPAFAAALHRPVLLLGGEEDGALGRLFRPGAIADEPVTVDFRGSAQRLLVDAVLVIRRSPVEYEPLRFVPEPSQPRGRTVGLRDIRRIARRGGVKRMGTQVALDVRQVLADYLRDVLRDAIILAKPLLKEGNGRCVKA